MLASQAYHAACLQWGKFAVKHGALTEHEAWYEERRARKPPDVLREWDRLWSGVTDARYKLGQRAREVAEAMPGGTSDALYRIDGPLKCDCKVCQPEAAKKG